MALWIITGASRGIGLEMVRQLTARGDNVIAACRTRTEDLAAVGCEIVDGVDVTSDEGAARLAQAVGDRTIDVLVNNAGLLISDNLSSLDFDNALAQYQVNALGPLRITRAVLDRLQEGSKIGIVTSRVGSLGDNSTGGNYGYRMSKAAANMAALNLSIELRARGIAVFALHPGYVRTEMTRHHGNIDPDVAARGLIMRLDELGMDQSGTFWHAEGYPLPW